MENLIFYLIIIGLFLFSMYNLWKILDLFKRRDASRTWPRITGKIIKKHVAVHSNSKGSTVEPQITYAYSVMGMEFTKALSLGTMWGYGSAKAMLDNMGDTIAVRYNPQKPEQHITDREDIRFVNIMAFIIPLAIVFIILCTLLTPGSPTGQRH
jgi:Protein of unknown function (DUF3592)